MSTKAFPTDFASITAVGVAGSDQLILYHAAGATAADKRRSLTLTEVVSYHRAQLLDNDPALGANSATKAATQQAVKAYANSVAAGQSWKDPVRAASLVNVNLATGCENGDTVGGVVLATGDRFAPLGQTAAADRGVYVAQATGAAVRAADMDADADLPGATFMVLEGTLAGNQYTCNNPVGSVTLGTTALTFVQSNGGVTTYAGDEVTVHLSANTFSLLDNSVTYQKMQNVSATKRFLMRKSAGPGDPEEGTVDEGLDFVAGTPTQGDLIARGSSAYARVAAVAKGRTFRSKGTGTLPAWSGLPVVVDAVSDYGMVADGLSGTPTDNTAPLQAAIAACAAAGGGVVEPAQGVYKFLGAVGDVPLNVSIRGAHCGPIGATITTDPSYLPSNTLTPYNGTTFLLTHGAGNANATPFLTLADNSHVVGITFYWPNQSATAVTATAYPWAIKLGGPTGGCGSSVQFCNFVNAYQAVWVENTFATFVHETRGSALECGLKLTGNYGVTRCTGVFWDASWAMGQNAGAYQKAHASAFIVGRNDLLEMIDCFCFWYYIGFGIYDDVGHNVPPAGGGPRSCWGKFIGGGADACEFPLLIGQTQGQGVEFVAFDTSCNPNTNANLTVQSGHTGVINVHGGTWVCEGGGRYANVDGGGFVALRGVHCFATFNLGVGALTTSSPSGKGVATAGTGVVVVEGCTFREDQLHVDLAATLTSASVTGNVGPYGVNVLNRLGVQAVIGNNTGLTPEPLWVGDNFTGAAGTLQAHAADSGHAWTKGGGSTIKLDGTGKVWCDNDVALASGVYQSSHVFRSPTQRVRMVVATGATSTGTVVVGGRLRAKEMGGSSYGYAGWYIGTPAAGSFQFWLYDPTPVQLNPGTAESDVAGTWASGDLLEFRATGASPTVLELYQNLTLRARYVADGPRQLVDPGHPGLFMANTAGGVTNGYLVDTFLTDPPLLDRFAGRAGLPLPDHTADSEHTWVNPATGVFNTPLLDGRGGLAGDNVAFPTGPSVAFSNYELLHTTARVRGRVAFGVTLTGTVQVGVCLRCSGSAGSTAFYHGRWDGTNFQIWNFSSATFTKLGADVAGTLNPGDVLELQASGTAPTTLSLRVNGREVINRTESGGAEITAPGTAGVYLANLTGGLTNGYKLDTVEAD